MRLDMYAQLTKNTNHCQVHDRVVPDSLPTIYVYESSMPNTMEAQF